MTPNLSPNPLASTDDSCLNHYCSGCKMVIFLFLTFLLHLLVDIFFSPIQFSKCFLWMSYNQLLSLFHCNAQIVSNMVSGSLSSRKIMVSEWNALACSVWAALEPLLRAKALLSTCLCSDTKANASWRGTHRLTLRLCISSVSAVWLWWPLHTRWLLPCRTSLSPPLPRSRPPCESGKGSLIFLLPVKYQEHRHGQASCLCHLVPWVPLRSEAG